MVLDLERDGIEPYVEMGRMRIDYGTPKRIPGKGKPLKCLDKGSIAFSISSCNDDRK
ncbi:unnamed protein product [Dovyalis caffra]|uniref:Uncharacterized protein n=1 Tax=Dovyalis caffra TaxID=77055 RepID=A0AAV1SVR9_9ROSI|nr:unnamed protein product [Dovyalis caffra]